MEIQSLDFSIPLPRLMADFVADAGVPGPTLPASRLPKKIEARMEPKDKELSHLTAWSLLVAITAVQKSAPPPAQMEDSVWLISRFQRSCRSTETLAGPSP
jgi:hypothetical protein